nr:hypothetical protein Q903MT_gene1329 [Picea sitchensis]
MAFLCVSNNYRSSSSIMSPSLRLGSSRRASSHGSSRIASSHETFALPKVAFASPLPYGRATTFLSLLRRKSLFLMLPELRLKSHRLQVYPVAFSSSPLPLKSHCLLSRIES